MKEVKACIKDVDKSTPNIKNIIESAYATPLLEA